MTTETQRIAVAAPQIPQDAIDFAKAVAARAEHHGIREFRMEVRVDTGRGSIFHRVKGEIVERMIVYMSRRDPRGRPRTKLHITADTQVRVDIVDEGDSTD